MVIVMAIEDFKAFVRNNKYVKDAVDAHKITWQQAYEHYDIYGEENWDFLQETKKSVESSTSTTTSKGLTLPDLSNLDFNQIGKVLEQLTSLAGMAKDLMGKDSSESTLEKKIFERYKD